MNLQHSSVKVGSRALCCCCCCCCCVRILTSGFVRSRMFLVLCFCSQPVMRNPWIYVTTDVSIKPTPPMAPAQGLMGLRREGGRVIRPVAPAHPKIPNRWPVDLPCRTAAVPDKVFATTRPSLEFPYPRREADGSIQTPQSWVKSVREQAAREIGTSPRACVRAFISPRSGGHVIYQVPSLFETKLTSTGLALTVDPRKKQREIDDRIAAIQARLGIQVSPRQTGSRR